VDVECDIATHGRQFGEGRNADGDIVTDTAGFNDGLIRMFDQQFSAKMSNHAADILA